MFFGAGGVEGGKRLAAWLNALCLTPTSRAFKEVHDKTLTVSL